MSEIKLKPCPFCGGKVELFEIKVPTYGINHQVECDKCKMVFDFRSDSKEEAAAKFNTRPVHPDTKRIDWIAEPSNKIGLLQLPKKCVTENPTSLRDAIDMAMSIDMAKKL